VLASPQLAEPSTPRAPQLPERPPLERVDCINLNLQWLPARISDIDRPRQGDLLFLIPRKSQQGYVRRLCAQLPELPHLLERLNSSGLDPVWPKWGNSTSSGRVIEQPNRSSGLRGRFGPSGIAITRAGWIYPTTTRPLASDHWCVKASPDAGERGYALGCQVVANRPVFKKATTYEPCRGAIGGRRRSGRRRLPGP
jgi:hypothetical protein